MRVHSGSRVQGPGSRVQGSGFRDTFKGMVVREKPVEEG